MSDYLINLGQNKALKSLLNSAGIATPQPLKRQQGPWQEKSLTGKNVLTGYSSGSLLEGVLPNLYQQLGAGSDPSKGEGEIRHDCIIFDASGIKTVHQLSELYQFFHESIKKLARCGKILIITRQPFGETEAITAFQAIEGFMRSVAKEIGRKGATANIVQLDSEGDLERKLLPVMHFFLSEGAVFIDGQVVKLSDAVQAPSEIPLAKALSGKIALVTGAAKGIGEATARTLAREGAKVLIVDIPALENLAGKVAKDIGGQLLLTDITTEDAPVKITQHLQKEFGGVDIVVHNAGITRDKTIGKMDPSRWDSVINVNLQAILNINKELFKGAMREQSRMICLSSISGFSGNFGQTNYAATKAGIIAYVNALSKELSSKNITVNAVAPGFIESDMTAKMPFMTREFARRLSNLSQGGIPQDIAEVITFLSSPGAFSITGQTVRVCGGSLIGA